jgi:3-hydroxyisobutyrate dehydrogenase
MTSVGWIGAGRMGSALATRLLEAGHDVAVYNRTKAKAEPLAERGATVVDEVGELTGRPVVFTSVSDSDAFADVAGALLKAAAPDVLVDTSTVSAEVSAQVRTEAAGQGTALLAAPISGNPTAVASGTASLIVSGPEEAFAKAEPLLQALSPAVGYAGDGESARLAKLCHNILLGILTQSLAETTVLAEKAGIRRAAFLEFLNNSVLGSTFTNYKTQALVELDFTPTFTTELLRKDFDLGLAAARNLEVPMPLATAVGQLIQSAIGAGHGSEDFAALLLEQARAAGLTPAPER